MELQNHEHYTEVAMSFGQYTCVLSVCPGSWLRERSVESRLGQHIVSRYDI